MAVWGWGWDWGMEEFLTEVTKCSKIVVMFAHTCEYIGTKTVGWFTLSDKLYNM